MNPSAIEALWYEEGTAADAAAAANMNRPLHEHVSAAWVRAKWFSAQKHGRLPPPEVVRPSHGNFTVEQREIIAFWKHLMKGRDAA